VPAPPPRRPAAAPEPRPEREAVVDLELARIRRRRRISRAITSVAAAVVVLGGGASVTALVLTGTNSGSDNAASGGGGAAAPEQLPTDDQGTSTTLSIPSYTRETLRSDLPEIAQRSAVSIITGRGESGPAGVMADAARRTACARTIRDTRGTLQAVQRIRYEGRMAYVFVFSDAGERTAYVVPDDCGSSGALPAAVLDTVS
jgi:hypothetical protein